MEVKTATPETQRNLEVVFSDQKRGVSNCTQMRHGKKKQGLSCNGNSTLELNADIYNLMIPYYNQ